MPKHTGGDIPVHMRKKPLETDLYEPVKRLLEQQGYEVKAEVGAADIVAYRDDEAPVIVELKTGFTLSLFHQAIARQALSDQVYIAVPRGVGKPFLKALSNNKGLCRRLGLGLVTIRMRDGFAEIHLDPAPYKPRKSRPRQQRLLKEFQNRVGDPNTGGSTRKTVMTSYRQDALRCLLLLDQAGPTRPSTIATLSGVTRARNIMADNHYGWFDRVERGIYDLSANGKKAVVDFAGQIQALTKD